MQDTGQSSDRITALFPALSNVQARALARACALYLPADILAANTLTAPDTALPARPGELLAGLASAAQRAQLQTPLWQDQTDLHVAGCHLDIRTLNWVGADGAMIRLTEKERDLLVCLAHAPGQEMHRDDLLARVWGYRADLETHTLETHIYRLRQKIEQDVEAPCILLTIPNGYKLA